MNNYYLLSLIPILIYGILKTKKSFHMLQQNWYNEGNRYLKWIIKNPYKVFIEYDMIFVIFIVFLFMNSVVSYIVVSILYLIFAYLYYKKMKKEQSKKPLVFTARVKRLSVTTFLLYLIPILSIYFFFDEVHIAYYYLLIGLLVYLNYFVVMTSSFLNIPVEQNVYRHYRNKAIRKLKRMNNLKVIGITGSYGKTSSKNILNDILNVKYTALASPKNFNTPYGLIITVNNYLDKFDDILIAEMGAFKKGEIKQLCDLVKPSYGILTKVGTAHLESFGSQENIQKGKFELIESLPSDGIGILNADDELQVSYKLKNDCKIVWIGIDNKDADVHASNIKLSHTGTTFDVKFKGDSKKYTFETKLLGKANIYNILAGIALGKELGIEIEKLIVGVKKVNSIEHRLELKKYMDINIIDDAYNSNPVGSKMALEVLGMMPGKKIIVTPGMIELADKEFELNMEFGKNIADVCDEVILVGETKTKAIYEGLINKGYDKKHIHVINDVKIAFNLMQELKDKETYVLLENDLPDIFNEE